MKYTKEQKVAITFNAAIMDGVEKTAAWGTLLKTLLTKSKSLFGATKALHKPMLIGAGGGAAVGAVTGGKDKSLLSNMTGGALTGSLLGAGYGLAKLPGGTKTIAKNYGNIFKGYQNKAIAKMPFLGLGGAPNVPKLFQ